MNPLLNRRKFLTDARSGLSGIALASLLHQQGLLADSPADRRPLRPHINPARPFAPRDPQERTLRLEFDGGFGVLTVVFDAVGEGTYTYTANGNYTHKATNVGPTPFHNVSFILTNPRASGRTVSNRADAAGFTQVMDNARVRAWRVVLEPGEETGQITQTAPGLRVYVRGGVVDELVPNAAPRGMAPYMGEFIWQDAGQTRAVKNTGSTIVEFVEFELK